MTVVPFDRLKSKSNVRFSPVFTPLLGSIDEAARGLLKRQLASAVPPMSTERDQWFTAELGPLKAGTIKQLEFLGQNLRKILVDDAGLSPIGTLRDTLEFACTSPRQFAGVYAAIKVQFGNDEGKALFESVKKLNAFRNTYVAHQLKDLTDAALSEENLKHWISTLVTLAKT